MKHTNLIADIAFVFIILTTVHIAVLGKLEIQDLTQRLEQAETLNMGLSLCGDRECVATMEENFGGEL